MTQQAQLKLEQRFNDLKASVDSKQWSDERFLIKKVEELESIDIVLAFRLMQRVKNLNPSVANQQKLTELRKQALKKEPELATLSSTESKSRMNLRGNAQSLKAQVAGMLAHPQMAKFKRPFAILVLLPFVLFTFYQVILASPRYESQARLIVKEPNGMATLDPAMAFMSGFGVSSGNTDTELVKAFIYSTDMLSYIDQELSISEHFSSTEYDFFSRLSAQASNEDKLGYFQDRVLVEIDDKSQIVSVFVQAFTPEFSHLVSQIIVARAEWFINEIGHTLAKEQLKFVQQEHALVEKRLKSVKTELLSFQSRHDLLDPQAEGMALQQIAYQLEGQIAVKRTELRTLRSSMSENAPQVLNVAAQLQSMTQQLENERGRLTDQSSSEDMLPEEVNLNVSQILAKFSDYKINLELALKAYTSSQVSLEKSRIEAYRQLKYLVIVESPTQPQEAKYPEVFYNISLFLAITLMIFGIGRIVIATVKELR
ncbi:MAG: capsular polysaccharide transport system permease protein [Alphaproteobacteria bacterium]|jgi:capsular polysaccharide transport system permease protein